jgi:hypothetical protein
MFSLEANNLTDEDGNSKQTSMPYFESGKDTGCCRRKRLLFSSRGHLNSHYYVDCLDSMIGWVDPKDLEKEQKRKEGGGFKFPWQN